MDSAVFRLLLALRKIVVRIVDDNHKVEYCKATHSVCQNDPR